jgi:hypothetical protein
MKGRDLAALAALAGGAFAFKTQADKDYAELPEQKEVAARHAKMAEESDVSGNNFRKNMAKIDAEDDANKRRRKGMKSGGKVSSASSRADGIAQKGKTKGRMV